MLTGLAQYTGTGERAIRFRLPDGSRSYYVNEQYGQIGVTPTQYAAICAIAPAAFVLIPVDLWYVRFTMSNPTIYIASLDNYYKDRLLGAGLNTVGMVLADRLQSIQLIGGARYGDVYHETFGMDEAEEDQLWRELRLRLA